MQIQIRINEEDPLLHGKAFHLSVGKGPNPGHSIELVG